MTNISLVLLFPENLRRYSPRPRPKIATRQTSGEFIPLSRTSNFPRWPTASNSHLARNHGLLQLALELDACPQLCRWRGDGSGPWDHPLRCHRRTNQYKSSIQWIFWREHLQETMDLSIKSKGFLQIFLLKPIHWTMGLQHPLIQLIHTNPFPTHIEYPWLEGKKYDPGTH